MESVITQEKYITEQEEQVSTAVKTFIGRIRSGFLELTELSKLHGTIRFLEHAKNLILDLKCLNGVSKISRLSVFQTAKFIQINNFAWDFKDFLKIICCASLARSITFNKIDLPDNLLQKYSEAIDAGNNDDQNELSGNPKCAKKLVFIREDRFPVPLLVESISKICKCKSILSQKVMIVLVRSSMSNLQFLIKQCSQLGL